MIMQETWVMIKHLKQQGMPIRAIARQLGIDRNTLRRALRRKGLPKYTRTSRRASKLDPFKPYLERRLVECPELTAVRLLWSYHAASARRVSSRAGHHYSVPYLYGGRHVQLRVSTEQARLEIWAEEICLAIHPLLPGHRR
jgi:transposase